MSTLLCIHKYFYTCVQIYSYALYQVDGHTKLSIPNEQFNMQSKMLTVQRLERKIKREIGDWTELFDSCKKCCHLQKINWNYTRGEKKKVFKPENKIKPGLALCVTNRLCSSPDGANSNINTSYGHLLARSDPGLAVPHGSGHSEERVRSLLSHWMGCCDGTATLSGWCGGEGLRGLWPHLSHEIK